jgi:hypothetical protein
MIVNDQPDIYELVWRTFKNTLIHELLFRFRRGERPHCTDWTYDPIFMGSPVHYYNPFHNRFLRNAFPLPEIGGVLSEWGNNSLMRIYMDDLFLCPDCGAFHPVNRYRPEVPWLDYRERRIDADAMFEAIEKRRLVKEFGIRLCERRVSCENTAKRIKEILYQEAETERLQLAWADRVEEAQHQAHNAPSPAELSIKPIKPPLEPSVYLIGGNGYVKIGIATNVKNRFSSLQTASPFPLKLLKTWKCIDAREKEYKLHMKFETFRQSGEWFLLPVEILHELMVVNDIDAFLNG